MLRNPLTAGRSRWAVLAITLTSFVGLFVVTSGAQAVVINDNGTYAGVAFAPGQRANVPGGMVVTGGGCVDPAVQYTPDLQYQPSVTGLNQLCWRGGSVINAAETFDLTWDPYHVSWPGTTRYIEQFLSDVASGSGSDSAPYAVTSQYTDTNVLQSGSPFLVDSRANNTEKYGGGCIDYGSAGGSDCQIGTGTTQGHDYPGSSKMGSCYSSGTPCLTDGDIQSEILNIANATQLVNRTEPGYTPLVVMVTPPGTVVCLDGSDTICSNNGSSTAAFCSYHSQVDGIDYVVQPWTSHTSCDESGLATLGSNPTPAQIQTDAGNRLVGPLSQSQIAAIVNPGLNGWVADDGSEIDDNAGCGPDGASLDTEPVGPNSYVLPREFNNAAVMASNPDTYYGCAPNVFLAPGFVVPSAVNQGDVVELNGSSTDSTLLVPDAGYQWSFGDSATATGPSVAHAYSKGGTYTITLTVTDRGGNQESLSQTIQVLGANGQPVPVGSSSGVEGGAGTGRAGPLQLRMQLMPQGLRQLLRSGIEVRVTANETANGFAYVSISRRLARRLHIRTGRGPETVIGEGTVSQVKDGTVTLYLHLAKGTVAKLKRARLVTFEVSLKLVGVGGDHLSADAAGSY
jgi:PKD repeat protein